MNISAFFNRFSIVQLSLASAVLFVIFLSGFIIQDIINTQQTKNRAETDIALVDLLDALEKVAHNHAVERGLTAGYLGNPSAEAKQKVDAQRVKADESVSVLRSQLRQDWPSAYHVSETTSTLLQHINGKAALRREVDTTNGANAFSYYSHLNRLALDAANSLTLNIANLKVAQELKSALLFAQFKERAGQVRGKINGTLAKVSINAESATSIRGYVQDMELVSEYLSSQLQGQQGAGFGQILANSDSRQINEIVTALLSPNPNFDILPPSTAWFPLATRQIGAVKGLLDNQWQLIKSEAQQTQASASSSLYWLMFIGISVIGTVLALNIGLITTISRQLRQLKSNLKKITQDGDLTVDTRLDSANELGEISQSVSLTIESLKNLIGDLDNAVQHSSEIAGRLNVATSSILDDAQTTQSMATSIAAAIEEMAATSEEIAQSAHQTLLSSRELDSSAAASIDTNTNTKEAMEGLNTNMHDVQERAADMEKQVTDIGVILETINKLADQTNLLALNAAIEAARAGEHGRGFAVVADEVRTLAQGSRESSDKISALLEEIQSISLAVVQGINTNVDAAEEALASTQSAEGQAQDVQRHAKDTEDMSTTVSAAAEEQSTVAQQIAQDVLRVQEAATHDLDPRETVAQDVQRHQ